MKQGGGRDLKPVESYKNNGIDFDQLQNGIQDNEQFMLEAWK